MSRQGGFILAVLSLASAVGSIAAPREAMNVDRRFGDGGRVVVGFDAGGGLNDDPCGVGVQSGGRVVIAGNVDLQGPPSGPAERFGIGLVRLDADGQIDTSFAHPNGWLVLDLGAGISLRCNALTVQSDDRIVLVGSWLSDQTPTAGHDMLVARLAADASSIGIMSYGFDLGGGNQDIATAVVRYNVDDRLLVAGFVQRREAGNFDMAVLRLQPDLGLDTSFGEAGRRLIQFDIGQHTDDRAMAIDLNQTGGQIAVAGPVESGSSGPDMAVALLDSNGNLVPGFGNLPDRPGRVLVSFDGDGGPGPRASTATAVKFAHTAPFGFGQLRIVVGGSAEGGANPDNLDFAAAVLNTQGQLDSGFNGNGRKRIGIDLDVEGSDMGMALIGHCNGTASNCNVLGTEGLTLVGYARNLTPVDAGTDFAFARLRFPGGETDAGFGNEGIGALGFDLGGNHGDAARAIVTQDPHRAIVVGSVQRASTGFDFGATRLILDRVFYDGLDP